MEGKEGEAGELRSYDIGYGGPPKDHRFPKGRSGNPKGRPKGTKNLKTDLAEELNLRVKVKEGGRVIRISKQRAMLKGTMNDALQGKAKAREQIFQMTQKLGLADEIVVPDDRLSETDQELFDRLTARLVDEAKTETDHAVEQKNEGEN
jgi:hypothetical protein